MLQQYNSKLALQGMSSGSQLSVHAVAAHGLIAQQQASIGVDDVLTTQTAQQVDMELTITLLSDEKQLTYDVHWTNQVSI